MIARKREIIAKREEVDAKILGALLRLNRERADGERRTKAKAEPRGHAVPNANAEPKAKPKAKGKGRS